MLDCFKYGKQSKKYSPKIRTFALTLHFYSPRAYRYVRQYFHRNLPAISTIRNWYSSINGAPGFSKEALEMIKQKANIANRNGSELLVCAMFDEMNIHKHLEWDRAKKQAVGYITYGTDSNNENQDEIPIAGQALVFMVVGVNEKFKIPIGYVLINNLDSKEKASLVQEVILLLNKTGAKTVALTFDGLPANSTTCSEIDPSFNLQNPFIVNPHSSDEIAIFLDACHMLKLIRNTLARKKVLYDAHNNKIEWEFIEKLHKYQTENNINLGNKLSKKHILWRQHIMCVRIAAETISDSVADSLQLLLHTTNST